VTAEALVGIDVGTTACKAAVVSTDGVELTHGRAPIRWRPVPTGAEIVPAALVDAALDAAGQALAQAPPARVLAAGVTSMGETGALLGADGEAVAPAIAWHDTRGAEAARAIAADLGAERFTTTVGLPPSPLCTLAKYRWLREHGGGAGRRWLNVAEWVVHRLGGEQVAELSLASRTGLLDLGTRAWWDEALAWAGAPAGLLPMPAQAGTPAGRAASAAARAAGLGGAVLAVAGHDHLCASVGVGVTRPAAVFDSCGTAEALIRAVDPPLGPERILDAVAGHVTVGWHVAPGYQALLGAQRAGIALQRFLDLLGVGPEGLPALDAAALQVPPGAGGLSVGDADGERATLAGIGRHPSPAQVWRAAAEAVGDRSAELLATIVAVGGPVERVVATGGWSRSRALRAVKASRIGEVAYPPVVEAGCRGAALLAGCAAGVFAGVDQLPPVREPGEGRAARAAGGRTETREVGP
jgi:sugar (pentulose or hexulose) kinase